jgi:stage II sporulation protein D
VDMIRRCRIAALCLLATSAACAPAVPPPPGVAGGALPAHIRVRIGVSGPVRTVPLEAYVRTAVLSEVAPDPRDAATGERMLHVQAIIARTYAVAHLARHGRDGYDVCSTTHCQLYAPERARASSWAARTAEVVRRTSGTILWYDSRPASAVFHADCGGRTSAARDVWGSDAHPYLLGRPDDGPARQAHSTWQFDVEQGALSAALDRDTRTRVGKPLRGVRILARDAAGRAASVELRGATTRVVRGEDLRAVMTRAFGDRTIRSTRFEVARSGSRYRFEGRGFGHGVGLCQAGALARLRAGTSAEQVLMHYYPGTSLVVLR